MVFLPEFDLPRNKELFPLKSERIRLGKEMVLITAAWGKEFYKKDLMALVEGRSEEEKKMIEKMIDNAGIIRRHHYWPPLSRIKDASYLSEKEIAVGAAVTEEALVFNDWKDKRVDLFIAVASAPLSDHFAEKIAERAGLKAEVSKLYCMFCNGASAALHDILRTEGVERAVITVVEGLSPGVKLQKDEKGEVDIAAATIFGSGASSLAFSPGKSIELLAGKTVISPDKTVIDREKNIVGVIRMPKSYQLPWPDPAERCDPPPWYEVPPEAEEVFAYSPNKVVMGAPKTDSDYVEMEGPATLRYFSRVVSEVVASFLKEHQDLLPWPETLFSLYHQPSKGVLVITGRITNKKLGRINRKLGREILPELYIPWVLDREIGKGNTSADTIFSALYQLENDGEIPKDEAFLISGFGAGSSETPMIVIVHPA